MKRNKLNTHAILDNGSLYVATQRGIYKNGVLVKSKNSRDNRIHKEGFDAGYKKGIIIGRKEMLEYISNHQGWEESRDFYAYHFGIRRQYKGGKPVGEK